MPEYEAVTNIVQAMWTVAWQRYQCNFFYVLCHERCCFQAKTNCFLGDIWRWWILQISTLFENACLAWLSLLFCSSSVQEISNYLELLPVAGWIHYCSATDDMSLGRLFSNNLPFYATYLPPDTAFQYSGIPFLQSADPSSPTTQWMTNWLHFLQLRFIGFYRCLTGSAIL